MTTIRQGWLHLASGAGVGRVLGFLGNLLLSRLLGPVELGTFNLVTTTVQTSDTLVRCGGDYAFNFELGGQPKATSTERGAELARGLAQICTLMTVILCIGFALLIWFGDGLTPSNLIARNRTILTTLLLLMIACEGISASAWEVLLVTERTPLLALKQGLFFPLRILLAAAGSLFGGVYGAMGGWIFVSLIQFAWLRIVLGYLWNPFKILPFAFNAIRQLLSRGLPFYCTNLLASMIFYPLLIKVASESGLAEIGYLRVGQILQQLFAFLPATLVPVLFLKLRSKSSFTEQALMIEKPLRILWLIMLQVLLLYCLVDRYIILWLFGVAFDSALYPTRLLLITTLFECLAQLIVQPLLATGQTRLYGFWQNGSAILAAVLGWIWIPSAGLAAYLGVRVLFIVIPMIAFGIPLARKFHSPRKILPLILVSIILFALVLVQVFNGYVGFWSHFSFVAAFILVIIPCRDDLLFLRQVLRAS